MAPLPPWLQINPRDFIAAAEAGAQAGLGVARINQAAREAQEARSQQASEFAQRMAQAEQEMAASQALKQWETQQEMQMRAAGLAQQAEKTKAEVSARTAYNLANLGLRERGFQQRERAMGTTEKNAAVAAAREARIAASNMNPAMKAKLHLRNADYAAVNRMIADPFTDPEKIPELRSQLQSIETEIDRFLGPQAPVAEPVQPTPALIPVPRFSGPAIRAGSISIGGEAPPVSPVVSMPETAALPAPAPELSTAPNIGTNWVTTSKGRRFRMVQPASIAPPPTGAPGWPANEEPIQ